MAQQAMASMAGLHGSSQAVLEGNRFNIIPYNKNRVGLSHYNHRTTVFTVRSQQQSSDEKTSEATSRRSMLGLVAVGFASGSFVQAVLAEAKSIKIGGPPPPSGGLPGTLNSDQARDLILPYNKDRFYLQPLSPSEAVARAKESAKEILGVKSFIDQKAWPYVQNDLRLRAEYLRFDLNTVISAKPKEQKQYLKDLYGKLFQNISNLDHAAKIKSTPEAEKYYAETVSTLNDVLKNIA